MKIRTKVWLGFALMFALAVGGRWFTLHQTAILEQQYRFLTDHTIPTLAISAEMGLLLENIEAKQVYHVLSQDTVKMNSLRDDIGRLQARVRKLIADYRIVSSDPSQQAVLDALSDDFEKYVAAFDKVRVASEKHQNEKAVVLLSDMDPLHERLLSRVSDLGDLNRDLAEDASDRAKAAVDNAWTGSIVVVSILAVGFVAFAVLAGVTILMPLRRLIATIDRLADGDLTTDIPLATRRDELGDVARALEHFRQNAIDKERLQKQEREDLEFARRIQLASVPRRFPAYPERREFDVCGRLAPTRAVGGDFFDFYFTSRERLVIAIGDASGKGVASAMFVGMARGALKTEGVKVSDPGATLVEANRTIAMDNDSAMFMTTFYGILDLESGELSYSNAGHTPPYLLSPERGVTPLEALPGLPLGVVEDFQFPRHNWRLAAGEAVVLYTDGVTEAAAADGSFFGEERLEQVLKRHQAESCEAIVEAVFRAVLEFSKGAPQADDIAILVVRYLGKSLGASSSSDRAVAAGRV